jgi:hypothetical protein
MSTETSGTGPFELAVERYIDAAPEVVYRV